MSTYQGINLNHKPMTSIPPTYRCLLAFQAIPRKDGSRQNTYVAVCLDHFIATQDSTKRGAKRSLGMLLDQARLMHNINAIKPAPKEYWKRAKRWSKWAFTLPRDNGWRLVDKETP